jgi:hypothetical protein
VVFLPLCYLSPSRIHSYLGSIFADILLQLAEKNQFKFEWNDGFVIRVNDIPGEFRGPLISPLASRILMHFEGPSPTLPYPPLPSPSPSPLPSLPSSYLPTENKTTEEIHTEMLGRAARNVLLESHKWEDWANSVDSLQHIKYLWHTLVVHGRLYSQNG